jgi:hypothetical protein
MGDIVHGSGDKIINANDFVAACQEEIGQMGAKESGGTSDDGSWLFGFHQFDFS